jgi:hypothetical protein
MKKYALPLIVVSSLAAVSLHAAPFWYDAITNLPPGCITTNPPSVNLNGANPTNFSNWYPHAPGSFTATDMLVVSNTYTSGAATSSKRLRVSGSGTEYIMRLFDPSNTNSFVPNAMTILYASFTASANTVPAAGAGTYFAAFNSADSVPPGGTLQSVTNGFLFTGRVFEIGNTNGNVFPFTNNVGGTFWYGVANGANGGTGDPAAGAGNINNIIFATNGLGQPIDLKGNMDVQVVLKYDIDNALAYLGINPASESDLSGPTTDGGLITNALSGLLFRQRTGGGIVDVRDISVGTSFADVMTNAMADTVVQVATNFNTVTNFPGTPAVLEVFATSIGGGGLSYQWYNVSGGATNPVGTSSQKYLVSQLSASDAGNYFCAVTNSGGKGALSVTNFYIKVLPDAGLGFTSQAASTNISIGQTLNLSCSFTGSGPYTIQWKFNGNALTENSPVTGNAGDISVASGVQTPTLTVKLVGTNEAGDFSFMVTSGASVSPNSITSSNAHVVVKPVTPVNIVYLRNLEDTLTWQPTDTTTLYAVSNAVVTSFTNTSGVGGYYIQDATAGINLFVSNDPTFIPHMGDLVTAVGVLSSFNNNLELACFVTNASAFYTPYAYAAVTGHTNLLPAPMVFAPYSQTNNAPLMETNIEGKVVMITNVFFTTPGTVTGNGSTTVNTTNSSGNPILVFFPGTQDQDIRGRTLPAFAWTITGIMQQFKSGAYSAAGYEVTVTRWGDILTNPPPAVTSTATISGNNVVLKWTAVPYLTNNAAPGAYAYSVLASPNATGPYAPLAQGLAFNTTNGVYTDVGALTSGPMKFYRISSP